MNREEFQQLLDNTDEDETVLLESPRERAGPVVIDRRIIVDGAGRGAIWARSGPVLHVRESDVMLRNLRIEYTGDDDGVALKFDYPQVTLEGVTVRGRVEGLAVERGEWRYPHQLSLGALAHGMAHTLRIRITVPVASQLTSEISGVTLQPRTLTPGPNEVQIKIESMTRDTLVFGTISIRTTFLRREIVLNAQILSPREGLDPPLTEQNRVVWQAEDWGTSAAKHMPMKPVKPPEVVIPPTAPPPPVKPVVIAESVPVSLPIAPPSRTLANKPTSKPLLGSLFSPPPAPEAPSEELPKPLPDTPAKPKNKPPSGLPSWVSPPPPSNS